MCCKKNCCKKGCRCGISRASDALVLIGALNWGIIGISGFFGGYFNLVNVIFGRFMMLEYLIYVLVGVAAFVSFFGCKCKKCKSGVCDSCVSDKCACGGDCVNGKCNKCGASCGAKEMGEKMEEKTEGDM